MELEIFIDKKGDSFKQDFTEDFDLECPFCFIINKYITDRPGDLYCKNCKEILVSLVDRSLILKAEEKKEEKKKEKSVNELIDILLNGEFPNDRKEAAVALGETGDMLCVQSLIQASMRDNKKYVRDAALKALSRLKEVQEEKESFFKDVKSDEPEEEFTGTVETDSRESILNKLLSASDMERMGLVKQFKDKFDSDFFILLEEEKQKAIKHGNQRRSDNLAYVSQILDNLHIKPHEEIPQESEPAGSSSEPEEEQKDDFLEQLASSSNMELIMLVKKNKEKLNGAFFRMLDGEIEKALMKGRKERVDSLSYISQILDNLKVRETEETQEISQSDIQIAEEEFVEEIPPMYGKEDTELLEQLASSSNMELIMLVKKNKEKFTPQFFNMLDKEKRIALAANNQERVDNLSYVTQILDNLNVKPVSEIIEKPIQQEQEIIPSADTVIEEEKISSHIEPSPHIEVSAHLETHPPVEAVDEETQIKILEKLILSSGLELVGIARAFKKKINLYFFTILEEEIQIAQYDGNQELLDKLLHIAQVLEDLEIRQALQDQLETEIKKLSEVQIDKPVIEEPPQEQDEILIEEPPEEPPQEQDEILIEEPPEEPPQEQDEILIEEPPEEPPQEQDEILIEEPPEEPPQEQDEILIEEPPEEPPQEQDEILIEEPPEEPPQEQDEILIEEPPEEPPQEQDEILIEEPPEEPPQEQDEILIEEPPEEPPQEQDEILIEEPPQKEDKLSTKKLSLSEVGIFDDEEEKKEETEKVRESEKTVRAPGKLSTKKLSLEELGILEDEPEKVPATEKTAGEIDRLLNILNNGSSLEDRKDAITSLSLMSDRRISSAVSKILLEDPAAEMRILAAETLVAIKARDSADWLLRSIKEEKNPDVRKKSAWAYSKLKYSK